MCNMYVLNIKNAQCEPCKIVESPVYKSVSTVALSTTVIVIVSTI